MIAISKIITIRERLSLPYDKSIKAFLDSLLNVETNGKCLMSTIENRLGPSSLLTVMRCGSSQSFIIEFKGGLYGAGELGLTGGFYLSG